RSAAAGSPFSYQSPSRGAKRFGHPPAHERLSELPISLRGKTWLWADNNIRKPPWGKKVRTLWLQRFESGRDHQKTKVLFLNGLPQHRYQEFGNRRSTFRLLTGTRVTQNLGWNRSGVRHRFNG